MWAPPQNVSAGNSKLLSAAARRVLEPFSHMGVTREKLFEAERTRCAQRLCMRIQIINSKVHVVAPNTRFCGKVGPWLDAKHPCKGPPLQFNKAGGKKANWTRLQEAPVYARWNPTVFAWHFTAGINVSTCSNEPRPGDFNGAFTRVRLIHALRLLQNAARRETRIPDIELIMCLGKHRSTRATGA